ncbi:hypothetical protein J4E85_011370 [Alternaria conjuncta]|uniref:uncharacterized protein n=1 Tax=Alternaria conjuncta TaxID=181017 RepID=UPI0022203FB6|nr:uncharacterized protein J4E85_011370 [Alternaria conjuncta]KAI4910553.1 hypothetical protein J4E85_011370 [Alternaria conjuncta]
MSGNSKAISTTLHLWTLDPVIRELQSCPAARAAEFADLIIPGRISLLSVENGNAVQSSATVYGASKVTDIPELTLYETGAGWPHPRSLRKILEKHQSWVDEAQLYPPRPPPLSLRFLGGDTSREGIARTLVEYLEDQQFAPYATTLTFRSPVIDRCLRLFLGDNEASSTLTRSSTDTTSIMSCGALLPVEASALMSTSTIHVLTGVRVYIVYPSTPHNLTTLHEYLKDLAGDVAPNYTIVCHELENGIAFVQRTGQTVTIPPCCPTVVFATKTSAAVTVRSRCVEDLPLRLEHLDILMAQIVSIQLICRQTPEESLEYHTTQLYKDMTTVLRALEPSATNRALLLALGAVWEREHSQFRGLVESHVEKSLKEHIRRNIPRVWSLAVQNQGLRHCPVCKVSIEGRGVVFLTHFRTEHWDAGGPAYPDKDELISVAGEGSRQLTGDGDM